MPPPTRALKKDLKIDLDIPQEILKKSAEKLDVIEGEIDQSVNIGYSQEDYEQTRSELAKLEERLKNVGEALEKHLRTIEDLANRANKLKFPA
jgi:DNA repair ATPase RecN